MAVSLLQNTVSDKVLAQARGALEGTVRGSEPGNPKLSGITVSLYESRDQLAGSDVTDNDGYYSITEVVPGTYRAHFSGDSRHQEADTWGIKINSLQTTTSEKVLTQAFGSISGTVTGSESTNLLSANNASFEGGTAGGWTALLSTGSVTSDDAWHISKSYSLRANYNSGDIRIYLDITPVTSAGEQYSASVWVKAGNAGVEGENAALGFRGNSSGYTFGMPVTLTSSWQRITATKTFGYSDTTRSLYIYSNSSWETGDILYADGVKVETGATANPFGLSGITMTVYDSEEQVVAGDVTDEAGFYHVGELLPGTYRLHFSGDSTHDAANVTGVVVVGGAKTREDVVLTLR